MSVTISRRDKTTGDYDDMPVAFHEKFNNIWAKAIKDRNLRLIGCCRILYKKDLKEILWEFAQVKDYVLSNDFSDNDKEYVCRRVDNILDKLEDFWNEIPGIEELLMG